MDDFRAVVVGCVFLGSAHICVSGFPCCFKVCRSAVGSSWKVRLGIPVIEQNTAYLKYSSNC